MKKPTEHRYLRLKLGIAQELLTLIWTLIQISFAAYELIHAFSRG